MWTCRPIYIYVIWRLRGCFVLGKYSVWHAHANKIENKYFYSPYSNETIHFKALNKGVFYSIELGRIRKSLEYIQNRHFPNLLECTQNNRGWQWKPLIYNGLHCPSRFQAIVLCALKQIREVSIEIRNVWRRE
jgi:hypothetical protein